MTAPRREEMPTTLAQRVARALLSAGYVTGSVQLSPMAGGHSGKTYLAEFSGSDMHNAVVKVAHDGVRAIGNQDMGRQAWILKKIRQSLDIPVPNVLAIDRGRPPESPQLFVMEFVDGEALEPLLSEESHLPPGVVLTARACNAARMLASMHAHEPPVCETAPTLSLSGELQKWQSRLERTAPEWLINPARESASLLKNTTPATVPARLNHGDWRLGNILFEGSAVKAVLDWEIWSVSDPRLDLGWLLLSMDDSHPRAIHAGRDIGIPNRRQVIEEYISAGNASAADIEWFVAFARYKQAVASWLLAYRLHKTGAIDRHRNAITSTLPELLRGVSVELSDGVA
jgi:aminoglycoside phosphotransferase (APT) family kinase protein